MTVSRIHVNQHNIRANNKGADLPVITVKSGGKNIYGNTVEILDNEGKVVATVVYSRDRPLSCGARVWVETQNQVNVNGESLPPDKIGNLVKLTPRLSVIERRQAVISFLELINQLPEGDERKNWSCRQIGAFLGVPYSTVNKIRQEYFGRRETPLRYRKV